MCNFKSVIILKDRVYITSHDSHQEMLAELGIEDTKEKAEREFVRAELVPGDGDKFSEPETWNFKVDQDIIPEWFVEEFDKQRTIEGVKEWMKSHVFKEEDNLTFEVGVSSKETYYFKDCHGIKIRTNGSSTAEVETYGSSTAKVWTSDSSTAKVWTSDSSTAEVETYDTSFAANMGTRKIDFSVFEDSVFKDNSTKTIYYTHKWNTKQVSEQEGK